MDEPKRLRGRPAGSKNKPKPPPSLIPDRLVPPSKIAKADYRYADPATLVARQFALVDWAQQALRNEVTAYEAGVFVDAKTIGKLVDLSNAITRNIESLKKYSELADEIKDRMTPEELLEAALKKVEGQDLATLNYAIKRLRAYRERLAPVNRGEEAHIGGSVERTATDAIASLDDE